MAAKVLRPTPHSDKRIEFAADKRSARGCKFVHVLFQPSAKKNIGGAVSHPQSLRVERFEVDRTTGTNV